MKTNIRISARIARRSGQPSARATSTLRSVAAGIGLLAMLLGGCLEPFPEETTTAAKVAQKRQGTTADGKKGDGNASEDGKAGKKKEKPKQTYRQAWEIICHAEARGGVDPATPEDQRGVAVADWIVGKLTNADARYWFINLSKVKKHHRRPLFEAEAAKVGISPCPSATLLFGEPLPDDAAVSDAGPADGR